MSDANSQTWGKIRSAGREGLSVSQGTTQETSRKEDGDSACSTVAAC